MTNHSPPFDPTAASALLTANRALAEQVSLNRRLQRIIMPPPVPVADLNGVRVAVRYGSADRGLQIGGDWCVSVPLPNGDLVLIVGDVAGHGLGAAATMTQLRYASAALAVAGFEPGALLAALNAVLWQPGGNPLATAVVAKYRPADATLSWSRAGHPPILVASHMLVQPWYEPAGVILGAFRDVCYPTAVTLLRPGDLLLMYTDGLIEEPGRCVDDGVDALAEQVRTSIAAGRPHAREVVEWIGPGNSYDDTCVLAAEPLG